jgi:hypothetical protein
MLVSLALTAVRAAENERAPPREPGMPKHLIDDAGQFFRSAKGALDKLTAPVVQTIYLAGVRDGAIGASVVLILIYLLFLQPRRT